MGSHSYNTSFNYTSKDKKTLDKKLLYSGEFNNFYSDILYFQEALGMVTKKNSCYILYER